MPTALPMSHLLPHLSTRVPGCAVGGDTPSERCQSVTGGLPGGRRWSDCPSYRSRRVSRAAAEARAARRDIQRGSPNESARWSRRAARLPTVINDRREQQLIGKKWMPAGESQVIKAAGALRKRLSTEVRQNRK